MKKTAIVLAFILGCGALPARGQSLRAYKAELAAPSAGGAVVRVNEAGDAARLINSAQQGSSGQMVEGYRVEIFSDNTSSARRLAYDAYARFREMYPWIPADEKRDIRYDSPKYTVRIGYFLTHEEAIIMCGKLKSSFKAYVRSESLPLSVFLETAPAPAEEQQQEPLRDGE